MSIFNIKNYDEVLNDCNVRINDLVKAINQNMETINVLRDLISSTQKSLIQFGKIQAQHKSIIAFLLNHASVDADAEEDLHKMMQEIMHIWKEATGGKK